MNHRSMLRARLRRWSCSIGSLRWLLVAALTLAWIAPTAAESLVAVESRALPAVPDADVRVFALGGDLIAASDARSWRLGATAESWQAFDWHPKGPIVAIATHGDDAFVLFDAASTDTFAGSERLSSTSGAAPAGTLAGVERLSLASEKSKLMPLPALQVALRDARAAVLGDLLYVAGADAAGEGKLFSMDTLAATPQWTARGGWPAAQGTITSLVAQKFGLYATFKSANESHERLLQWTDGEGWTSRSELPGSIIDGAARAIGQAHVLYLIRTNDGGTQLLSFHTITGSWATLAKLDALEASGGTAWRDGMLWQQPMSDGSTRLVSAQIQPTRLLLAPLDWFVIAIYMISMIGMGLYFYLREKRTSTSDFFVGGRTIPFWAAGVSLYATNTSSISYIAIPAKSFESNWQYLTNNLIAVMGLMFVAVWIVPLLRRLNLMSVFQYLETRFHPLIRTLASALCIAVQIGSRLSIILFLPSLAIATITGIDVRWSIVLMATFTMVYTAMGGMKAVIWTDFVQLFVKMGGVLFAIGFIVYMLDGRAGDLIAQASAEHKMKLFDFSWDLTQATVWGFIFLVVFDVVLTFPKDQVLMQRVLSTPSAREAGRSVWMFAAIMIPGGFLFYMVGTALFVFYRVNPERVNPLLPIDATFPMFIAAELPMGVRGLIIAGILAAAMATLSSIMNSVATLASVDFYEKLVRKPDPKTSVRFAEAMTVVTGLIGMGLALLLSRYDIHSLFDVSIELAGLLGGGFAGAYTLGMFTRRANAQGVAIGIAASIVLTVVAWSKHLVHPYFYLAISILLCIVIGYVASLFFPAPSPRSLAGLTIYGQSSASEPTPSAAPHPLEP